MSLSRRSMLLAFSCAVANAAGLVPVPTPPPPSLPLVGLEANKGQAKTGILFLSRGNGDTDVFAAGNSIAATALGVLYSPLGATLGLVAGNPSPSVSFSNPLHGFVNSYTGADPHKWVTGIPRYSTADLAGVYPGINARYTISADGILTLKLLLAAGIDPKPIQFQIVEAASMTVNPDGSLVAFIRSADPMAPRLFYPPPNALQATGSGQVTRSVSFAIKSATTFGLAVKAIDPNLPLQISIQLASFSQSPLLSATQETSDAAGNTYFATAIADAPGKDAPFPEIGGVGCGNAFEQPQACSDVAIYKYSAAGVLQFITYLAGETNENAGFVGLSPGGSLVVAGTTDSADFPVTAAALQTLYAGPAATPSDLFNRIGGDFFAATLDPATGFLQSSTFLGGPNADTMGTAALGADGSLYFLPVGAAPFPAPGMPVTRGALQPGCSDPCLTGYVARLSPALDSLIYGTYLPGSSQATARLYSDGSVYYAGIAGAGFPTTPNAYQPQNSGGSNVIVVRLDPTGNNLLSATYYGGPNSSSTFVVAAPIAVAPDGSVWVSVSASAYNQHLIHLDAGGSQLLADLPIYAGQMVVDAAGDLIALAEGPIIVSEDAILGGTCGGPAYIELSPTGQQLFATYLPAASGSNTVFDGADAQGKPYVSISPPGRFQVVETQPTPPSVGCVVDASFSTEQRISPGAIVTIFGAGMGPSPGVGFQLVNGLVPTSLGGTRVLVNGEPAPILYSSYGQLNLIIPYSLPAGPTATLQVVTIGTPLNPLSNVVVLPQAVSIFLVDGNASAAALNEDYTVNSPQHPAHPGSTVMLFGTGGGQTDPPSVAGEVTPPESRPLLSVPQVYILSSMAIPLNVEYAGAAPTQLSGVTQINVTLPDVIPASYPPGTLHLSVVETGVPFFSATVTMYVSGN